jgi:hypothetical protein
VPVARGAVAAVEEAHHAPHQRGALDVHLAPAEAALGAQEGVERRRIHHLHRGLGGVQAARDQHALALLRGAGAERQEHLGAVVRHGDARLQVRLEVLVAALVVELAHPALRRLQRDRPHLHGGGVDEREEGRIVLHHRQPLAHPRDPRARAHVRRPVQLGVRALRVQERRGT